MVYPVDPMADMHMHTTYSDGKSSMKDMVQAAIAKGLKKIVITDHMPLPQDDGYAMSYGAIEVYQSEIAEMKKRFKGSIELLTGMEMEYMPGYVDWDKKILAKEWDWLIGSVHCLERKGSIYIVDFDDDRFVQALEDGYDDNIKALSADYYLRIQEAVRLDWFNVIGHFDLIKKNNKDSKYFDEKELWYRRLVIETLDVVQESGITIEINTAGFDKPCREQYPSDWIIEECIKREIPLVLSSDAHKPEDVGKYFERFSLPHPVKP